MPLLTLQGQRKNFFYFQLVHIRLIIVKYFALLFFIFLKEFFLNRKFVIFVVISPFRHWIKAIWFICICAFMVGYYWNWIYALWCSKLLSSDFHADRWELIHFFEYPWKWNGLKLLGMVKMDASRYINLKKL